MNDVLYKLSKQNVRIIDGWYPYPSTGLCDVCNLSLYQTRKQLKKLKEMGLVESCIECVVDEERNFIIRGYRVTEKGKKTDEYKKALSEERQICKEIFGIDIGEE